MKSPESSHLQQSSIDSGSSQAFETVQSLSARVTDLELQIASLHAKSRDVAARLRIAERSSLRGWLSSKFSPRIFQYEQYPPRQLKLHANHKVADIPNSAPSIAIVTPSLNHAHFLSDTIESVVAQNYPFLSYRVQDGGSSDETSSVLQKYEGRLQWQSKKDGGQSHAINLGFSHLDGEIMAYLNSDDMLLPGSLAYVAKYFSDHPDVDVVYGHRIAIDRDGLEIGRSILPAHDPETIKWCDFIPQETMFWRRRVWDAVGGIDENFQYAMDWDFILRAHSAGFKFVRVPRFLGCFRVHDMQKTSKWIVIGDQESAKLRERELGYVPLPKEINRAIRGYVRRHVLYHRLYKLNLVRY